MSSSSSRRASFPSAIPGHAQTLRNDDLVVPFQVAPLGVRGRVVRLGAVASDVLLRHDYPDSVARLLGEAAALATMLGSSLKFAGQFILKTRTDGPVDLIVVDFDSPGALRAYAHFDDSSVRALEEAGEATAANLLGAGHLAMTIDQGSATDRYQGVVPLNHETLAEAAHVYFRQSEQIPTEVRLCAAPLITPGKPLDWRAGGILIQHLPAEGGMPRTLDLDPGEIPSGAARPAGIIEDDRWVKARALLATVEDHELLDPELSALQLLYRLYHEDHVRAGDPVALNWHCRCSRPRIENMLRQFSAEELADMNERGEVVVTCEFCNSTYRFDADTLECS